MLGFLFGIGITLYVLNRTRNGGFRRSSRSRRRRRREWVLNRISRRLDTTASQDRVLEDVVDDLMDVVTEERDAFFSSRSAVADALRGEEFDAAGLDAARARQEQAFGRVHDAIGAAMKKAHATLDAEQREELANWIGRGHRGRHCRPRGRHLHAA